MAVMVQYSSVQYPDLQRHSLHRTITCGLSRFLMSPGRLLEPQKTRSKGLAFSQVARHPTRPDVRRTEIYVYSRSSFWTLAPGVRNVRQNTLSGEVRALVSSAAAGEENLH